MNGQEWLDRSRIQLFEVFGRVNERSVQPLAAAINRALAEDRPQVILDLSGVEYMNSAGLRTLADILTRNRANGGDLLLVAPNPKVERVFKIIGFDKFFNTFDTVDLALAHF